MKTASNSLALDKWLHFHKRGYGSTYSPWVGKVQVRIIVAGKDGTGKDEKILKVKPKRGNWKNLGRKLKRE
jgi:hypothetical protein